MCALSCGRGSTPGRRGGTKAEGRLTPHLATSLTPPYYHPGRQRLFVARFFSGFSHSFSLSLARSLTRARRRLFRGFPASRLWERERRRALDERATPSWRDSTTPVQLHTAATTTRTRDTPDFSPHPSATAGEAYVYTHTSAHALSRLPHEPYLSLVLSSTCLCHSSTRHGKDSVTSVNSC